MTKATVQWHTLKVSESGAVPVLVQRSGQVGFRFVYSSIGYPFSIRYCNLAIGTAASKAYGAADTPTRLFRGVAYVFRTPPPDYVRINHS